MCGIAGCIGTDICVVPEKTLMTLRHKIDYRGRDGKGEWTDGKNVHLFHTRLSIIDLKTGQQPMWDRTERYVIVYNGEIYNYRELRDEYEKLGVHFITQSDTEVILAGFAMKGAKICSELNGMFAFAIWDCLEKRLFLARDHLGKKPLFWCSFGGVFYFASTIDAFVSIPGWQGHIANASMTLYALLETFPEDTTVYDDVYSIPYASYCFVNPGDTTVKTQRFWRMDFASKSAHSFDTLIEEYESLLTNALSIRLRSDVPIALTFSGGVDSGTLAALCVKKLNFPISCYTIDYHTEEDPSEETIVARKAAEILNLNWTHIQYDYHKDLLAHIPETYQYYDQPSNRIALVYMQLLFETIKPYATVVISGNGADELFTGYIGDEMHRRRDIGLKSLRWARPIAKSIVRMFGKFDDSLYRSSYLTYLRLPIPLAYAEGLCYRSRNISRDSQLNEVVRQIADKIAFEALESGVDSIMDFRVFMNLTCSAGEANYRLPDISGLAAQVEVRSPYLDYRMVEFAARLPHKYKVGNLFSPTFNKFLPKTYYGRYVPSEISFSRKKGMGANLRWDLSIRENPTFLDAFQRAFVTIDHAGMDSSPYRQAWKNYRDGDGNEAGVMLTGFMLGEWLNRDDSAYLTIGA